MKGKTLRTIIISLLLLLPAVLSAAGNSDSRESSTNTLVVYFSATGSTERVAGYIAGETGADLFEIVPADPYTRADLNYNNSSSRVVYEHDNPEIRPEIAEYPDLSAYDIIFLGYPLWWQSPPNIIHTFVENTDLSGKIVIPFSTSLSTGTGRNAEVLHSYQPAANWIAGERFQSRVSESSVQSWVESVINNL